MTKVSTINNFKNLLFLWDYVVQRMQFKQTYLGYQNVQWKTGENLLGGFTGNKVEELIKQLLYDGRVVINDNSYTSVLLLKYPYDRKTLLLGTFHQNRRALLDK